MDRGPAFGQVIKAVGALCGQLWYEAVALDLVSDGELAEVSSSFPARVHETIGASLCFSVFVSGEERLLPYLSWAFCEPMKEWTLKNMKALYESQILLLVFIS